MDGKQTSATRIFDLTTAEGIDACESDLNAAEPRLIEIEETLGLAWGLVIGGRRAIIAAARAAIAKREALHVAG